MQRPRLPHDKRSTLMPPSGGVHRAPEADTDDCGRPGGCKESWSARGHRSRKVFNRVALCAGGSSEWDMLERRRYSLAPPPHLVVATLPQQAVGSRRPAGKWVGAGHYQRIGKQRRGRDPIEIDWLAVDSRSRGKRRRWVDEVGPAHVELAQLVHRVFVEVREQGRPVARKSR